MFLSINSNHSDGEKAVKLSIDSDVTSRELAKGEFGLRENRFTNKRVLM